MHETPLLVQLAPAIIAGLALILGAFVTFFLTLQLEHRKWLRHERLKAYEGYAAFLRSIQFSWSNTDKPRNWITDFPKLAAWVDQIRLIGTDRMRRRVEHDLEEIVDRINANDPKGFEEVVQSRVEGFHEDARRDLKISRGPK
jgi:hypothetical protein